MATRSSRARLKPPTGNTGAKQLTLAHLIVTLENFVQIFARPIILAIGFLALAWFDVLPELSPWLHLLALTAFLFVFFKSVGLARAYWRPVPFALALRRVEEASGLQHRPLDVLADRPVNAGEEQRLVWQQHAEQARQKTENLAWPKWKLNLSQDDPYAVRYGLLAVLVVALTFAWGAWGGRILTAINPAIGKLHMATPTLDAWITPPEYTHLPPIMIATPADNRHGSDVIDVPEGSVVTVHLAEKSGTVPNLRANDEDTAFTADDEKDFNASATLHAGNKIVINRGWQELGSWRIHIVKDQPPQIALTEAPSVTERKSLRLSYKASDDFGVASVSVRITPKESVPGAGDDPIEIPLSSPDDKQVTRISFEDLTSHPWAGSPVQIQMIATDAVGHSAQTEPVDFTLPERNFVNPVAHALIDERKKILQAPDNDLVRTEAANIMAGIAHQPENYHGDPAVMMALRSGAVRLILDTGAQTVEPVAGLMWQSAVRIEDGTTGLAEQNLRKAQKDLADALDRNASEQDIQKLIGQLHQALNQYLAEVAQHMASHPGPVDDISQLLGQQSNVLNAKDLDQILDNMRNLSATGSRDAARQQLAQLQQVLENMRTQRPQLSEEQKQTIKTMLALRDLAKQQQQLLDKTFQNAQAHDSKQNAKLAGEQNSLLKQLQNLMNGHKAGDQLGQSAQAMGQARQDIDENMLQGAIHQQNTALQSLQQAMQSLSDDLKSSMMMLPMPGMDTMGAGLDPFGRAYGARDDGGVKVPDQMEVRKVHEILNELERRSGDMTRPKTERDYIGRLLQNF